MVVIEIVEWIDLNKANCTYLRTQLGEHLYISQGREALMNGNISHLLCEKCGNIQWNRENKGELGFDEALSAALQVSLKINTSTQLAK